MPAMRTSRAWPPWPSDRAATDRCAPDWPPDRSHAAATPASARRARPWARQRG